MKRLYAYIRVSTARQGEHGVSLQEQRDAITRYADRSSLTIAEWFEERQTAAKSGRPVFSTMLRQLKSGKADGVVIHKIDRSARNLRDWADLGELIDRGIDVHFANEPLDLRSRGGRLSADILAVVAADFIRNNREETRKGFYGRLKQGIYPLPAPVGYVDCGAGKPKDIDPVRGPLARYAFERYASGSLNLEGLRQELTQKGLRNRNGGAVTMTGLSSMLRNPFYVGIIKLRTGETFEGAHPSLVPTATFQRVQGILDGKAPRRTTVHDYLFRRRFACLTCKRSLIGTRVKGRVYYRCQTRTCPTTCVREDDLEKAVLAALRSVSLPELVLRHLEREIATAQAHADAIKSATIARLQAMIANLNARLTRLTDAYLDAGITKEVFEERRVAHLLEKQRATDSLAALSVDPSARVRFSEKCLQLLRSPENHYQSTNRAQKRRLIDVMTSNRYVTGKEVRISLAPPFHLFINEALSSNGAPFGGETPTARRLLKDLLAWTEDHEKDVERLTGMLNLQDTESEEEEKTAEVLA